MNWDEGTENLSPLGALSVLHKRTADDLEFALKASSLIVSSGGSTESVCFGETPLGYLVEVWMRYEDEALWEPGQRPLFVQYLKHLVSLGAQVDVATTKRSDKVVARIVGGIINS